ncbi:hypothetical protein GQ53DRAFT_743244 [Thozetella sp. PMI_491]|nr:hypothetical protein GQ53DRAFT_743244 [Thozetella sp. PMI_491]
MSASGSVFSETLQAITTTKLEELSNRRTAFEKKKEALLVALQKHGDSVDGLVALSTDVKKAMNIPVDSDGKVVKNMGKHPVKVELLNLDRFLDQARYDPSVSIETLKAWKASLLRHLDMQSLKFSYASLYGQLVNEWLSKEEGAAPDEDVEMKGEFENVDDAKKLKSRMEWEKLVFEPGEVNVGALRTYLETLFGIKDEEEKTSHKALKLLREEVAEFEKSLDPFQEFTSDTLRPTILGLIDSKLLTDEKREVLKDFNNNHVILAEVADVLNMRMGSMETWSWGSGVVMEQRRSITGAFNIMMHEDLLHAIFLQRIGVRLSVFLKEALVRFRRRGGAWKRLAEDVPAIARKRLGYYMGRLDDDGTTVQARRRKEYRRNYFLSQLLSSEEQRVELDDGEEEAEYEQFSESYGTKRKRVSDHSTAIRASRPNAGKGLGRGGAKRHRKIIVREFEDSETEGEDDPPPKKPMETKSRLLKLLSTEIVFNTRTKGELTAFHSTFASWNALLPHNTIYAVFQFLGFSPRLLRFFKAFLEAPLRFLDDDASSPARIRRRGTPASHVLSDAFGEAILFCLDLAVNRATSGKVLWRMRDDIWFWSHEQQHCVQAWEAVRQFSTITGTSINYKKSGSVRITANKKAQPKIHPSLPTGDIRWGFLYLSPETGRFVIDQDMVDAHIDELRKQLQEGNKSIFDFVQTWNTYAATFFTSNFGKPANCFGRDHVDEMLRTHERIQRQIFSSWPSSGTIEKPVTSVSEYLKNALQDRFGIRGVPDGYLFFPVELGGLDLRSPFISLLQVRDSVLQSPEPLLDTMQENEREFYGKAKKTFENGEIDGLRQHLDDPGWEPESEKDRENFMSFQELVRYRDEFVFEHETNAADVWSQLMTEPSQEAVEPDEASISAALSALSGLPNLESIKSDWNWMEPYWKWVTMLYGPELVERFGGISIVDPGLLPMGMVKVFRERRVKWQT